MHELKAHGLNVNTEATTIEEAADSIMEVMLMIRDITIGQYYPARSVLHRLDPREKLGGNTVIFDFVILI